MSPDPASPPRSVRDRVLGTRFGIAVIVALVLFMVSLATRLTLVTLDGALTRDGVGAVLRALAAGAVIDIAVTAWLVVPLVLYLALASERWYRTRIQRRLLIAAVAGAVYLALCVALSEMIFFDEFNGRFNFVAVDYLIYPTEVTTNILESYPAGWLLLGVAAVSAGILWIAHQPIKRALDARTPRRARLLAAGVLLAALAVCYVAAPLLPTRVSSDRALNEIAGNGYRSFLAALTGQDAPYEGLYATRDTAATFTRLHRLVAEPASAGDSGTIGSTERHVRPLRPERRLNVVIVLEESLGSDLVGVVGARRPTLTPRFDSLASEGTLLTHAYSTGNRTIRALEATTSSLPPLPGISIVRRPQSRDLFTLPGLLRSRGYATEFIYGGRAIFDGMGAYMRNNGMERVVEQSDYPEGTFTTAWGVADEAIFDKALVELDSLHATGKPFYALILSVSNHRPYTYPEGRIAAPPSAKKRVNAVQYADYALGRFVRQAREHAFFDSTIFVLMGDHGARVYGAQEIPLASYEVPIVLYAPKLIPAGVKLPTVTSSLDIPPTVLSLLGMGYDSRFFGHDVLTLPDSEGRALMTHNNVLALMKGPRVVILGLRGAADVFRYDSSSRSLTRIAHPDRADRSLVDDAIAYFSGADRMYRSGSYQLHPAHARHAAYTDTPPPAG
jgi:phosphoglycerol transferase MdoB-like AlkP superfamily enzyme